MDNLKAIPITSNTDGNYCDHSNLTMEFAYGSPTGNFICTECGRLLSKSTARQAAFVPNSVPIKTMPPSRLPVFIV